MKYILGTKIGMVQLFDTNGKQLPTTIIHCEPNKVLEVKSTTKHGHNGVKVGYLTTNEKKLNKVKLGIFTKANSSAKQYIATFSNVTGYNVGDEIKVSTFTKGEYVDVQGVTKGHGFTGAIKRWNFKIGPLSHGAGYVHRYQGSVAFGRGGSAPQRVPKGKKMAGQYGHEVRTIQNLIIIDVLEKRNLILILGAIPGPAGSVVQIKSSVKKPNAKKEFVIITKEIQEEILKQNENLENKEALHAANEAAEATAKKEAEAEEAKKAAEAIARAKQKEAAEKSAKASGATENKEKK
ncbi:MAG: 50S ribosomal protein L3 [Mycoplasmataceae bacterium]|nr:50S ribosomal protein L3 [Mycoplasmataceae bacterium]